MAIVQPVKPGHRVRLADIDPSGSGNVQRSDTALAYEKLLDVHLPERQELLYSAASNSVLIVLQGIDTAGKEIGKRRVGKECLRLCRSRWSPYH